MPGLVKSNILSCRVRAVVVVQRDQSHAIKVARLGADVEAGVPVELMENRLLWKDRRAMAADIAVRQRSLKIVQGEAARRHHRAGRFVPAEDCTVNTHVKVVAKR